MKKLFFFAVALFAATLFTACCDDDDKVGGENEETPIYYVKQLIKHDYNDAITVYNIEYDDRHRITKIEDSTGTHTYTYIGNKAIDENGDETILNDNGAAIELPWGFCTYDSDGYIFQNKYKAGGVMTYIWENGDQTEQRQTYSTGGNCIEYRQYYTDVDNQNLWIYGLYPIRNITSELMFLGRKSKHLLKSYRQISTPGPSDNSLYNDNTYEYEYTLDSKGRPTKIYTTVTYRHGDDRPSSTYDATYELLYE